MGSKIINFSMKETDTSSLTKISTDQLGKRVVIWGLLDRYIKTTGTVFSPPRTFAA
jgi:hypothetical protein